MFNWFKKKSNFLEVDLHSHLIPGIDDGVKTWDESLDLISELENLGYKKIITTPHIIHDYYPNSIETIKSGVNELNSRIKEQGLDIIVQAGAEYYMDEHFAKQVNSSENLLTFGEGYILIETPFLNKPIFFEEVIFNLQSRGLKPILAHPERYTYIYNDPELIKDFISKGLLMQINISSLTGYYSKEAQSLAKQMILQNCVHFLASDIHNHKHLNQVKKAIKTKLFQKCRQLNLMNSTLLGG